MEDNVDNEHFYTVTLGGFSSHMQSLVTLVVPIRYIKLRIICLDYGRVAAAAIDDVTKTNVIIYKYCLQDDKYWLKEQWKLLMLREHVCHVNIIRLLHCYSPCNSLQSFTSFYTVTESLDSCLQYVAQGVNLSRSHRVLSQIVYQLLSAVKYLHLCGVTLKTLNSGNIMLSTRTDLKNDVDLKITGNPFIVQMSSYLSPEQVVDKRICSEKIDSWSVGCVLGELLLKQSVFPHNISRNDLFESFFEVCGKPSDRFLEEISRDPRLYKLYCTLTEESFGEIEDIFPDDYLPESDPENTKWDERNVRDLLAKLLCIDPEERTSIEDAINHPYVQKWKNDEKEDTVFVLKDFIPDAFSLSFMQWKQLFYKEVKRNEIKLPLYIHSLKHLCIHSISTQVSENDVEQLHLPRLFKDELKNHTLKFV